MASRSIRLLTFVILILVFSATAAHARKLLLPGGADGRKAPSLELGSLVFGALPKGYTPPSRPSPGIDAAGVAGEWLPAGRTSAIDRMLGSVPSPGVGH